MRDMDFRNVKDANYGMTTKETAIYHKIKEAILHNEFEPGKGIIVPVYTLEDILEVYDLLEVLQVYALEVSLKNYDLIADATLGQILEQTKKYMNEGDLIDRMEWDAKFHNFIIQYVGKRMRHLRMQEVLAVRKKRNQI